MAVDGQAKWDRKFHFPVNLESKTIATLRTRDQNGTRSCSPKSPLWHLSPFVRRAATEYSGLLRVRFYSPLSYLIHLLIATCITGLISQHHRQKTNKISWIAIILCRLVTDCTRVQLTVKLIWLDDGAKIICADLPLVWKYLSATVPSR